MSHFYRSFAIRLAKRFGAPAFILRRVYRSLRDDVHKITVDPELAARGRKPVERMLSIV
jgi:hypothetical protein